MNRAHNVLDLQLAALLALLAFHHHFRRHDVRLPSRRGRPERLVRYARNTEPLIEPLIVAAVQRDCRDATCIVAGRVARILQRLTNGCFPLRHAFGNASERHGMSNRADSPGPSEPEHLPGHTKGFECRTDAGRHSPGPGQFQRLVGRHRDSKRQPSTAVVLPVVLVLAVDRR